MGFIRRGNYEQNTTEKIIDIVRHHIISEYEKMTVIGKSDEESKLFIGQFISLMGRSKLIIEDKCYVGITANPIQSLNAHGIDIYEENTFLCMDIPFSEALKCRDEIIKLDGFDGCFDKNNDYIDDTFEQLYIYIYKISGQTKEKIDICGFTPLKQIPPKPIIVRMVFVNGLSNNKYFDEFSQKDCDSIVDEIKQNTGKNLLKKLTIIHRELNRVSVEFGDKCCIINYYSGTSQTGSYQGYRSGEKSRKKVKLYDNEYPEYMLCRDLCVFESIIRYFLIKGKKPTKRQNIKWVNLKA